MPRYLELTEDQMVDRLAKIQRLARDMLKMSKGPGESYDKIKHEKAVQVFFDDIKELAESGNVV